MTTRSTALRTAALLLSLLTLGACSFAAPKATSQLAPPGAKPPTREELMRAEGQFFGVSTFHTPSASETATVTAAAGRNPTMLQYFLDWRKDLDPAAVQEIYHEGAVPMLTWEPGDAPYDADEPPYALRRITAGDFDQYVVRFADEVRDQRRPMVLRFAHEMNGDWYPWGTGANGNSTGDYVAAWRHVHDLFADEKVDNVIWLWSPNVLRDADNNLASLYPGDDYVDWVGMDAYGFGEPTASEVLDPTYTALREITSKPVIIAETGTKSDRGKPAWTTDLFRWLRAHPRVLGFVWFEHSMEEGGKYDYRFTETPQSQKAFHDGLATLQLRQWPVVSATP